MTIFERFSDAFNHQDVDALMECFTDDATYDDMLYGRSSGAEELRALFERMMRETDEVLWKADTIVASPSVEMVEWTFRLTLSDEVPRSAGKTWSVRGVSIFELRDGRCRAYREYFDRGAALIQLGLEPAALHRILSR
jgi:steroid delta-isomerase-like uncharacterized protein